MHHPEDSSRDERRPEALTGAQASRRRLLRGGAAAAPVVLTLASNPVMATSTCTAASAFASLNASRPSSVKTCTGKKPSWWASCSSTYWPSAYQPNTKWQDCGFSASPAFPSTTTLRDVCKFTETAGHKCVAAHMAAALLNAKCGYTPGDVLGEARVKSLWNEFARQNFVVPTAGVKWYDVSPTVVANTSPGGVTGYVRTTMS